MLVTSCIARKRYLNSSAQAYTMLLASSTTDSYVLKRMRVGRSYAQASFLSTQLDPDDRCSGCSAPLENAHILQLAHTKLRIIQLHLPNGFTE